MSNNDSEARESRYLKSVFIPEFSLQGTTIPMHILWDKKFRVNNIVLCYSSYLEVKEIYNVAKEGIRIRNHCMYINGQALEVNGYIGLVLKSKILADPYVIVPMSIEITWSSGDNEKIEQRIVLFRPHIVVHHIPSTINVKVKDHRLEISNRIVIKNEGYATAIVKFEVDPSSDVKLTKPEEIEEYVKSFCEHLSQKLNRVKKEFPQYSNIVSSFEELMIKFAKGTFTLTEDFLSHTREVFNALLDAMEKDEVFARALISAIVGAYIAAINILTEFRALLEYLRSIAKNRVLLVNAMHMLELQPGSNLLKGYIRVHDLAGNVYSPIHVELQINVNNPESIKVPVYELFQWGEQP